MPSAIKHDHELSNKGLVSILVEAQGADDATLESFLWKTFPDNNCFSSIGAFVPIPESKGIPHGAVVGVDGTLLWAGNPITDAKKIEELVLAELAKCKKGWGDTAEARKLRAALYGKGDLQKEFTPDIDKSGKYGGKGDILLKMTPKQPSAQYKNLYLVVDPSNYRVKQSVIIDTSSNVNQFMFFAPDFAKALKETIFEFNPSSVKNYRVIDADQQQNDGSGAAPGMAPTAPAAPAK